MYYDIQSDRLLDSEYAMEGIFSKLNDRRKLNKTTIKIIPHESVSKLYFGALRKDVRKVFGGEYKEVKKIPKSENTMDVYANYCIYYNADNRFIGMDISPEMTINTPKGIIPSAYNDARGWLQRLDSGCVINASGAISNKYGIAIHAPNSTIESIHVFTTNENIKKLLKDKKSGGCFALMQQMQLQQHETLQNHMDMNNSFFMM